MHILTIASGKGGTGKTTTAVTLAAIYAEAGARVLVVDLDPQGSASAWLGAGPEGWVVLDCGPGAGALQTAAVAAAGGILAPVELTALGLGGIGDLAALVEGVGAHVTPAPALVGILACKVDPRLRLARAMLGTLRARHGALVLDSTIRATVKAAEAAALKRSLVEYDPGGPATADYRAAAVELQRRLEHDKTG